MSKRSTITVCGPKATPPAGSLKLTVSSHAPASNPAGWKDLWRLSPFVPVDGGVAVPGLPDLRSRTVENAWQFLKTWDSSHTWDREAAMAAFASDCAIRFPRGRGVKATGHYWGETGQVLEYVIARRRIYTAAYLELMRRPQQQELIFRLRDEISHRDVLIWDFDSYDIAAVGLTNLFETIFFRDRPFAHAFLVALEVLGLTDRFIADVDRRLQVARLEARTLDSRGG